jgi:hypothetical protein
MPGVRYGPDISDDAAYVVDSVKEIQEKIRRGLKLGRGDNDKLDRFAKLAKELFDVERTDFDAGRFGEMGEMARYGGGMGSRENVARSWRTGRSMVKGVDREFADRGSPDKRSGSSKTPDGAFYVGRTRSKRFRELEARVAERVNTGGVSFGKARVAPGSVNSGNFIAQIDSLNVGKVRGTPRDLGTASGTQRSSSLGARPSGPGQSRRAGTPIRPSKTKSKARAQQRARKRVGKEGTTKARELASKGSTRAKGATKPRGATRAKK